MTLLPKSLVIARKLRLNQTEAERHLWLYLRDSQLGYKFRRQTLIENYIVDFLCLKHKLIVELDGGQHNEIVDKERTTFLEAKGYYILRFWNNDVLKNTEGVLEKIVEALSMRVSPHPDPHPKEREDIGSQ